ncbi:MAG TPA: hypothetical protein VMR28_02130 [Candidatus Saccharimonadales bacterium]|nr:hypothetical protein [Candidatus Saccharimonadales bacterium]
MATIKILSPHIDDAVFSCWHLINQPNTEVITVFAGVPSETISTVWDRLCGESNSSTMMRKRLQENKLALSGTVATYRNLTYLDQQYQPPKYDIAEIANTILAQVDSEAQFYVPLAGAKLWRHPDHVTVRSVGKFLLSRGRKVSFYADIPYMQMPSNPSRNYKNRVHKRAIDLIGTALSIEIYELSHQQQIQKLKAMLQYESQYKITNLASMGTLKRRANVQRELVFHTVT